MYKYMKEPLNDINKPINKKCNNTYNFNEQLRVYSHL